MPSLTDSKVRNAKPRNKPYKLMDSHGLFLYVTVAGSRIWRFRYRHQGKEQLLVIGDYPTVSLAAARQQRDKARALVKDGKHLGRERRAERLRKIQASNTTFEGVAREWIGEMERSWRANRRKRVCRTLEKEVFPKIGQLPLAEIKSHDLLAVVKSIAQRGAPHTALLVQQLCSAVFRHGIRTALIDSDPTYAISRAVKRSRTAHHKPLQKRDIPVLIERLNAYSGSPVTKAALHLLLLTFVRPGEARQAQWDHFDLLSAEWRIPAHLTKMNDLHIVPLSTQAVDVLRELESLTGRSKYLFPNIRQPRSFMAPTTLNRALENMGFKGMFSAHGFRATASTFLNELGYRSDLIERQLGHKERDRVRASYNQAQYLGERRNMMQAWADYLDGLKRGTVVHGNFGQAA